MIKTKAACDDWTKIPVHCAQCGVQFLRKVRHQKYCDEHRHLAGAVIRPQEAPVSKTGNYHLADPENDLFSDAMDRAVSLYHSIMHGAMRNAERAGEGNTMDGEKLVRRALAAGFKAYLEEIGPKSEGEGK